MKRGGGGGARERGIRMELSRCSGEGRNEKEGEGTEKKE